MTTVINNLSNQSTNNITSYIYISLLYYRYICIPYSLYGFVSTCSIYIYLELGKCGTLTNGVRNLFQAKRQFKIVTGRRFYRLDKLDKLH